MKPAVLSCESTGTNFTKRTIERMTKKELSWHSRGMYGIVEHVYPEGVNTESDANILWARKHAKIVVPMRHPIKALISNYEHTKTTLRYINPYPNHARSFGRVSAWVDCFFLQCEDPDFSGLADYLGIPNHPRLSTEPANITPETKHTELRDWFAAGDFEALDKALDGAVTILGEYRGFFRRFGYEIP